MIQVAELQHSVHGYFQAGAREFGLNAHNLSVSYVLNAGGFVNSSFHITDGARDLHLKLATNPHSLRDLQRWFDVHQRLEQSYHAPAVLDWVAIPDTVAQGLLFARIDGRAPTLSSQLLERILPVLQALNNDAELSQQLGLPAAHTAQAVYLAGLHERFIEDLRTIREKRPSFVSAELLDWMSSEVQALEHWVREHESFAQSLVTPVHGDLWLHNILVTKTGEWFLLDWDDLQVGDPVMDLATLTGPSAADLTPLKMRERTERGLSADQRARLQLLGRATLLDWVIDPLADYIDAEVSPEHLSDVRRGTERVHRAALELYRSSYPPLLS